MNRDSEDPILLELVRYSLDAIADEMSLVLVRTAYSINLKNTMDMCCAICDAEGRLIVQGLTLPLHLGSIPEAMRAVRRALITEPLLDISITARASALALTSR